jgi:radical SAM protein with 4Fe4S-binding SPASM domain
VNNDSSIELKDSDEGVAAAIREGETLKSLMEIVLTRQGKLDEILSPKPDSNAIALEYRNFGYLQESDRLEWGQRFVELEETNVPYPNKAIVELLNSCNLDCPMCRVGRYGVDFKRSMSVAAFRNILSELSTLQTVRLNGLGESTLLPDFDHYIDALSERGIFIELITNGFGQITSYHRILDAGGSVFVSWDAAEQMTFEQLRRPAKWKESCESLLKMVRHRRANGATGSVSILFTLQRANVGQLERLVGHCARWGVGRVIVNVVKLENSYWTADQLSEITNDFNAAQRLASMMGIQLSVPDEINGYPLGVDGALRTCSQDCFMPWQEVVIRWNGDVQVCNMFNPYIYGNIFLNSFYNIWNNRFANLFRDRIKSPDKHPYCRGCVYFDDTLKRASHAP